MGGLVQMGEFFLSALDVAPVKMSIALEGRGSRVFKGSKWCLLGMGTAEDYLGQSS